MPPTVLTLPQYCHLIYVEQVLLGCSYHECNWTPLVKWQRTGVLPQYALDKLEADRIVAGYKKETDV